MRMEKEITMKPVMLMKKMLRILFVFCLSAVFFGCSSGSRTIELQDGVEFQLVDALKTVNQSSNSVYYYFLASVTNHSDEVYHMSNLDYEMASQEGSQSSSINAIDRMKTTITNSVSPGQSTFVYGYIGFANANQKDPGLYFPGKDQFLPFSSVKVRTINDENIKNSDEAQFTIYEDEYFEFDVDSSDMKYTYKDGKSQVTGLIITYRNKTDQRLVVPYLSPVCTIDGIKISERSKKDELKKMSLEELKKQDFSEKGNAPKTVSVTGEALGYQLYYLGPDQEVSCPITFEFSDIIPDFSSKTGAITIRINSPALGYSQIIKVNS